MIPINKLISIADIRALPKVDLHRHLEGAMRPETLWEFFKQHERPRYAKHEFIEAITVEIGATPGFIPFLQKFNALRFHYGKVENLERVAYETVEDAARDGVIHLELRFSPVFFARRLLKDEAADAPVSVSQAEEAAIAVMRGGRRAAAEHDISLEFIATCARHFGFETNRPTLELLKRPIGEAFCGLDLAGHESIDAVEFVCAFREWKDAGKFITIHAGEDPKGPGPRSIYEALDVFRADRIGHGVRAFEDIALIERLSREAVPLELCPTSNVQTQTVSELAQHPIREFLASNIVATVNTDDPSICKTSLSGEYSMAAHVPPWNFSDIVKLAWNGARAAFLPYRERDALAARISAAWEKQKSIVSEKVMRVIQGSVE